MLQKENKVLRLILDSLVCLSSVHGLKQILKKIVIKEKW